MVLVPVTNKLDVPILLVIAGLVPVITNEPSVSALFCKSNVALLIFNVLVVFPKVPVLLIVKVPPLIVVLPV